jgi:hypothetical protein
MKLLRMIALLYSDSSQTPKMLNSDQKPVATDNFHRSSPIVTTPAHPARKMLAWNA